MKALSFFLKMIAHLRTRQRDIRYQTLGINVEFDGNIKTVFPDRISIGNYVYIGTNCYLNGQGGLRIDDHTIIAPEVAILTSMHRFKGASMVPYDEVDLLKSVSIGRCVWIGMRALILPGVTLGEGCIVGAGAVVTRSFQPGSILGGNPAEIINQRDMTNYQQCVEKGQFYLKLKHELGLIKKQVRIS